MGATLFVINVRCFILKIKFKIDKSAINEKEARPIQAAGTCTYMILTESLCL